jgi:aldehyde:ferredoxin oxidoreductase
MIKGGFTQKLLRINLSDESVKTEKLPEELLRKYYGGRTLGGRLLYDEAPPGTDPLGPENKIIVMTGALVGTPVPGANRYAIITLSPATGLYLDSYSGGCFGPEIKFAGYDVIIVEGKAKKPVYIVIDDDKVELRDASELWGKTAWDAEEKIGKELGDEFRACVIGPAGEKLSSIAIVQNEYYHEAGRGGAGAVFGSKLLKGIAVRGTKGVKTAEPGKLIDLLLSLESHYAADDGPVPAVADRMKYGTPILLDTTDRLGVLPAYNFKYGQYEHADKIGSKAFREVVERDKSCFACNLCCIKFSKVKSGKYAGDAIGGPEYETNALLGSNIGVSDMNYIVHVNGLCNDYGVDTISAGVLVGFAMECYEKGILAKEDFGGLEMTWGNEEAVDKLIRMIAYREGIGDLFADGVKKASEKIGKGSENFAIHVKGLEFPGYRPGVNSPGFGLSYCIADRGGCHRRAWPVVAEQALPPFTTTGRAELVKKLYDLRSPWHDGICCDIAVSVPNFVSHEYAAKMYSYVTGWDVTAEELQRLSERTASLLRAYNVRNGMKRGDDALPARCFEAEETEKGKGLQYTKEMLDTMLGEYYALRGWNEQGVPAYDSLVDLDMRDVADDMRARGHI